VKTDLNKLEVPPYYPDNEIVRRNLAKMYDNTARLDSVVGKLLKELEDEGLLENTIVFSGEIMEMACPAPNAGCTIQGCIFR
jgi:N-sulfoglucosamine sulfohydrolase